MAINELRESDSSHYKEIQNLLQKFYGIKANLIKEFYSFEDHTYYIEDNTKKLEETEFTLKVMNTEVSQNPDLYEQITQTLLRLSKAGFSVPTPIKNVHGKYYSVDKLQESPESSKHLIFLLKFLPGKPLIELKQDELSKENFFDIVQKSAKTVAEIIEEIGRDSYLDEKIKRSENPWKLENFTSDYVLPRLQFISNQNIRNLSKKYLVEFEEKLISKLPYFRNAVINNDVNSGNIILNQSTNDLVDKDNSRPYWEYKGLIDFGELTSSKYLFEVATFLAFMMISAQSRGYDVMATADCALSGFEEVIKLNDEERSSLRLCVIARLIILISASGLILNSNKSHCQAQIKFWHDQASWLLLKLHQDQKILQ